MAHTAIVRRRAALALLLILLAGLWPLAAPAGSVAAQEGADVPREEREVEVRRGDRTIKVRPIKKVKTADGREAVADRLIVGFRPGLADAEREGVQRSAAGAGGMRGRAVRSVGPNAQVVDVGGAASLERAIQVYRADPRVEYAEPDYIRTTTRTPNDPLFSQQWGMTTIRAPQAWDVTQGSASRVIAVLDCGIYDNTSSSYLSPVTGTVGHPDINGKVINRHDFTGSASGADDLCNHGTHVAGIAAANTNNSLGVAGVGYNVRLLNGKVLDDTGSGFDSWIARGIRWATDNGAHVINMSLGGEGACPPVLRDAINYAYGRNVVVVAAAGNDASGVAHSPASCPNTLAVASTNTSDTISYFSNYGASWVDVAAPGSSILSTCSIGTFNTDSTICAGYKEFSGTSMAAPHVAGLAALTWSLNRYSTAQQVVNRITGTADRIGGTGAYWQHGRINAYAAVTGTFAGTVVDGGHNVVGAAAPRQSWLFAEGYTPDGFDEYLTIMNPSSNVAPVTITYYLSDGASEVETINVARNSRATVNVHDGVTEGVGRGLTLSAKVETTNPDGIVVERPMYFRYSDSVKGGHNALGAAEAKTAWYFAEGYTGDGFDEYLTILNPDPTTDAQVKITYYLGAGAASQIVNLAVGHGSRATVNVHETAQGVGRGKNVAAKVETTNGVGIVVERPMYFRYNNGINGGHVALGVTSLSKTWHFAEGYTNTGFDEYLSILNPGDTAGEATITYFIEATPGGLPRTETRSVTLPARSRTTVNVHEPQSAGNPGGLGRLTVGHGTSVVTTVDAVVERPMYFTYNGAITGGHDALGANAPGLVWYFAEGYTGAGFDEYLTIMNPNASDATVTMTYYLSDGTTQQKVVTALANSRYTVKVHETTDGVGRDKEVSAKVESTVPIVVERPIYFRYTLN
jgi:thermitase